MTAFLITPMIEVFFHFLNDDWSEEKESDNSKKHFTFFSEKYFYFSLSIVGKIGTRKYLKDSFILPRNLLLRKKKQAIPIVVFLYDH